MKFGPEEVIAPTRFTDSCRAGSWNVATKPLLRVLRVLNKSCTGNTFNCPWKNLSTKKGTKHVVIQILYSCRVDCLIYVREFDYTKQTNKIQSKEGGGNYYLYCVVDNSKKVKANWFERNCHSVQKESLCFCNKSSWFFSNSFFLCLRYSNYYYFFLKEEERTSNSKVNTLVLTLIKIP